MRKWKKVNNFEDSYLISNDGIVKTIEHDIIQKNGKVCHIKEKIKKNQEDKDGYLYVSLCKNGKNYPKRCHRLVAEAFIPNPNKFPCVNHKDEDKKNNKVENLEWCTIKYNNNYGNKTKNTRRKINQYDLKNNYIKTWDCIMEIAKYYNISRSNITEVCKGSQKTCKGFIWRYNDERS